MSTQEIQSNTLEAKKPLRRTQEFLKELKSTIALFRELLVELKGVLFDLALIAFFVWEMIKLFKNLQG
jgi:hypothetical protein